MKTKYPHPLPPNGVIAVTAPASPVDSNKLQRGVQYLNKLGYNVEVGDSCHQKEYYLAGSDRLRAEEFMKFIRNPEIDALFCARGGYGSMRLLPLLNFSQIRKQAKLLVGFSDITALEWAIWQKSRLVTVSAGMVATDMAREPINQKFEELFWQLLKSGEFSHVFDYAVQNDRHLEGHLLPGTLSVGLRLLGSEFFPRGMPYIPLLEDINEPSHKLEGHLLQLFRAGFFQQAPALLIGQITPPGREEFDDPPPFEKIISYVFGETETPVISGLPYGHIDHKIPLPVGAPISLYLGSKSYIKTQDTLFRS